MQTSWRQINHLILLLVMASMLAGCATPILAAGSGISAQNAPTATPYIVEMPADATPTPTPFRPLAPTESYLPTNTPTPTFTPTPTATPTSEVDAILAGLPVEQLPGQMNILLLGSDARAWNRSARRFRTDTIILATLNSELGTVNLTSFPRDLYLNIPGHGQDRINTAYFFGGWDMLHATFKQNFGVAPDHYVIINFENFKRFIDSLGGLDVNVENPVADYFNGYWTSIPAGEVHMDADTVLWYVRSRKTTNDFARNKRQQEILLAVIEEVLTVSNIRKAPELYEIYKETVITDLALGDVLQLLPLAARIALDKSRINTYFVGPKQVSDWITPGGAMVLLPDMDAIRRTIRKSQNLAP